MKEGKGGGGEGAEEEHLEKSSLTVQLFGNSWHTLQLHGRRGREGGRAEKKRGGEEK